MNDLCHRINAKYDTLRRAEQRVADYLLQRSDKRFGMTIAELAAAVDVSKTTVSRFCRVIGYAGFQDFRLSLAATRPAKEMFHNIPADIRDDDSTPAVATKLASAFTAAVKDAHRSLRMRDVNIVVDTIAKAKKTLLCGVGGSGIVVEMAQHLFIKAGLDCAAYTDGYMQTVTAAMTDKRHVVIGVSDSGTSRHVVHAVRIAAGRGAATVAITSDASSPLAKTAAVSLITPPRGDARWYGEYVEARVCQLYVFDLLYLRLLFKLKAKSTRALRASTDALKSYYSPEGAD